MKDLNCNPFTRFAEDWAVVTAGTPERFNGMTVSWGAMGTVWGKSAVTLYIRPDRYTWQFLKDCDTFTLCFFPEERREALRVMGSMSGRDGDKAAAAGLTPRAVEGGVGYAEASETLVCRKLFMQQMDYDACPDAAKQIYRNGVQPHWIVIGELIDAL